MRARLLVAGMGNELLGDDGFGVIVARRFAHEAPSGVHVIDSGIAGVSLVQDLMDGFDSVVICDAMDRGDAPGTVRLLELDVPALERLADHEREALLADTHLTLPARALLLARALGALPPRSFLLGCQPARVELGLGLSPVVEAAVEEALRRLRQLCHSSAPAGTSLSQARAPRRGPDDGAW